MSGQTRMLGFGCSVLLVPIVAFYGFSDDRSAPSTRSGDASESIIPSKVPATGVMTAPTILSKDTARNLQAIGGHWYLLPGAPATYYFKDGERFVDLFSYHAKDSNKDGIDNIRLSHDDRFLIVQSQGYPNHPTALFPNSGNPNSIRVQNFTFRIPLRPVLADHITRVPMGPIGMALNGVVFFNPFEMGGLNAVEGYSEVWLDSCCGHPEQRGVYHYHKYPSCVKSPFPDSGTEHSPVLGFAFDGFPLYGPYEESGVQARDLKGDRALDVCNGHHDPVRGYHYHVTPGQFPYIIGGYAGVPERSNSRPLNRSETGAIENNSGGVSRLENVITSLRPGSASRGQRHSIQFVLNPQNGRRHPVPPEAPSWAQIGPFEAKKIMRQGNIVTVEIDIPKDASMGPLLDCHLEFDLPFGRDGRTVYKRNDAFRVVP